MTDLEITKLCAEAMGYEHFREGAVGYFLAWSGIHPADAMQYNPLHDDAQAMALVKGFNLTCANLAGRNAERNHKDPLWRVYMETMICPEPPDARSDDLNRAICECVAAMQVRERQEAQRSAWK